MIQLDITKQFHPENLAKQKGQTNKPTNHQNHATTTTNTHVHKKKKGNHKSPTLKQTI